MYVTKIGERRKKSDSETDDALHRLHPLHKRRAAYSFGSVDDIISVCRRLAEIGFSDKSSVWRSHLDDKYFLILEEPEENAYLPLTESSFIFEYGKSENLKHALLFLHEHADCICSGDAVESLANL